MSLSPLELRAIPRACLAPVTELAFVHGGSSMLAASGPTLTLYSVATGRVLDQIALFAGQRIHAIRLAEVDADGRQLLIVFGGRSIAVLQLHPPASDQTPSAPTPPAAFTQLWTSPKPRADLIWDAKLLRCSATCCSAGAPTPSAAGFDLAIGYAHDRVELVAFRANGTATAQSTDQLHCTADPQQYQCEDRSLLYSMRLHGSCRHQLMVIGGTVFSQLLIWDASVSTPAAATASSASACPLVTRPIVHRISGHEGVIFKIECNADATLICSVSDDRTVRLWRWRTATEPASEVAASAVTATSSIPLSALLSSSVGSYSALSCCYGHRSRVWRCALLASHPLVLSSSEDNTCIVWDALTGEPVARFDGQKGGLWALAVDEKRGMVATGAGDASIRVWNIEKLLSKSIGNAADTSSAAAASSSSTSEDKSIIVSLEEWMPKLSDATEVVEDAPAEVPSQHNVANSSSTATKPKRVSKPPSVEYCREVLFDVPPPRAAGSREPTNTTMYVVTSRGRIFSAQLDTTMGAVGESRLLHHHTAGTAAIVAVAQSPCNGWLALGDQRGSLLIVSTDVANVHSKWMPAVHASAINFLMWLPLSEDDPSPAGEYTLLTADALNEVKLWSVTTDSPAGPSVALLQTFRLPMSKARLTCAVVVDWGRLDGEEADASEHGKFLLCGDSRGSVYAYYLPGSLVQSDDGASSQVVLAVARLAHVHEKAAVTSLAVDPASLAGGHGGVKVYSTATDGKVIEYTLSTDPKPEAAADDIDSWVEKHNSTVCASEEEVAVAASFSLQRKRVHKLSTITLVKQVHFSSASASSSDDILVSGFHANDFILFNLTQNVQMKRWPCGGDKRSWAFHMLRRQGGGGSSSEQADQSEVHPKAGGSDGFLFCFARHGEEASGKDAATASAGHHGTVSPSAELVLHVQAPSTSTDDASASKVSLPSLGCAIHGRLTTSVAVVPLRPEACLIITASEDNSIKLFSAVTPPLVESTETLLAHTRPSLAASRTQLSCVATLVDHPDVVRSIVVSSECSSTGDASGSSSSLLLFSGGGREFLHCTRIVAECRVDGDQPVAARVESLGSTGGNVFTNMGRTFGPKRRTQPAAASTAGGAASLSAAASSSPSPPPPPSSLATQKTDVEDQRMLKQDVRIMCLTAAPIPAEWIASGTSAASPTASSPSLHLVVSGNSVGVVKFFLFDSARHSFRLVAECPHHHYTLLSMAHVVLESDVLVFSGATDGWIRVWSVRRLVERAIHSADATTPPAPTPTAAAFDPVHSFQAHASGVDCLSAQRLSAPAEGTSSFLLMSGGDDEAIHACTARWNVDAGGQLDRLFTRSWANSHHSAVKSLTLEGDRLYSVSYDQRLRMWHTVRSVAEKGGAVQVELVPAGSCLMDIWDLSTVRTLPSSQSPTTQAGSPLIVVGGHGLQLLQLSNGESA